MMRVVGLDLSLSDSGVVRFDSDSAVPVCAAVKSSGPTPQTVEEELERMRDMAARVVSKSTRDLADHDEVLFVFEGPAPAATHSGKAHERAGLWWLVALNLRRHGRLVAVKPNTLKSYWTGNGSASKELMLAWAQRRYPELFISDHNVADALALASMGARQRGIIPPRPPLGDETFITGVAWPD